jgi:hypothetical protein
MGFLPWALGLMLTGAQRQEISALVVIWWRSRFVGFWGTLETLDWPLRSRDCLQMMDDVGANGRNR